MALTIGDKVALWCGCDKGRRASKKDFPDRVTIRLGSLQDALADWCLANNKSPSQAAREALALLLEVDAPAMDGNVRVLEKINAKK